MARRPKKLKPLATSKLVFACEGWTLWLDRTAPRPKDHLSISSRITTAVETLDPSDPIRMLLEDIADERDALVPVLGAFVDQIDSRASETETVAEIARETTRIRESMAEKVAPGDDAEEWYLDLGSLYTTAIDLGTRLDVAPDCQDVIQTLWENLQ